MTVLFVPRTWVFQILKLFPLPVIFSKFIYDSVFDIIYYTIFSLLLDFLILPSWVKSIPSLSVSSEEIPGLEILILDVHNTYLPTPRSPPSLLSLFS